MTMPIDSALLPADVRAGGPRERKLYEAAVGFERLLTNELTKSLASAIGGGDDSDSGDGADSDAGDSSGTSAATSAMKGQLGDQLAAAVQQGGGLGLAPILYRSLSGKAAR